MVSMTVDAAKNDLPDDLIWGVRGKDGIAAFLRISEAKAYYLISINALPVKKLGRRTITARRSELREALCASNAGEHERRT
jgi:hypothetical protein